MEDSQTTQAIQGYLDQLRGLRGDQPVDPVVRALLTRSVGRLHALCSHQLYRRYPRLTRPPLSLETEEMLSAIVERLIKALRKARPENVKQFFAIANQHMRWELNDFARLMDDRPKIFPIEDDPIAQLESSGSGLSQTARRIFDSIDRLPEDEREAFDLVRVQGLTHAEAAEIIGVSTKTIQRRLNRSVIMLSESLSDLAPTSEVTIR